MQNYFSYDCLKRKYNDDNSRRLWLILNWLNNCQRKVILNVRQYGKTSFLSEREGILLIYFQMELVIKQRILFEQFGLFLD